MTEPLVRRERPADGVLVVTIDRAKARNSINDAVADQLADAFGQLDEDESLRAAVLTGAGGGFCAGLDLKAFLAGETGEHQERGFAGLVRQPPRKPLLAAIEGFALAGGLEVALACDLVVAASDARWVSPRSSADWWPTAAHCCGYRSDYRATSRWRWH